MTERQRELLNIIIKEYIHTAEPVSSKLLCDGYFDLSSATIRSEMSDLENEGYLAQKHTSGGRVPTDKGYRTHVDDIDRSGLKIKKSHKNKLDLVFSDSYVDAREFNRALSHMLSALSDHLIIAGIEEQSDFCKHGLSSLFDEPEFQELERVFQLTNFFDEFEDIFPEFNRAFRRTSKKPIRILIGSESPFKHMKNETMMLAEYNLPQGYTGALTLVGPTRMDYERNLGLLGYTINQLQGN